MPVFQIEQLDQLANRILNAAGVPEDEAAVVSAELAAANSVGHDSHGVMRLMQYVDMIDQGFVKPGAPVETVKAGPSFVLLDANFNFGQVGAAKAVQKGIELARSTGTATVMIRNCNHVGRLGSYSQSVAMQGLASMMAVNAPGPGGVAAYGGIDRKLGTNPISMSAPWQDSAFVLDMTTSATAEGKIRVAFQKGEPIPEGLLIDAEGNPTTDPGKMYAEPGGAILPLGGPLAFKGFGLSVMIDLFCGVLSGSGVCRTDLPRGANGVWMYFVDLEQFISRAEFDQLIDTYVSDLKSSRKQPGVEEILMPGEIELRRQTQRCQDGVQIPDETWRQLNELAERIGTSLSDFAPA